MRSLARLPEAASTLLGEDPYRYLLLRIGPGNAFSLEHRVRYCAYVLHASAPASLNDVALGQDEFVLGEAARLRAAARAPATVLLALHETEEIAPEAARVLNVDAAKRVDKPWGYEIWLTGDPAKLFAFKKIFLRAGTKTSLQYHRRKRETNFVLSGKARFHYNPVDGLACEDFRAQDAATADFDGPCIMDVPPNRVHRLEALTDLLLYEISTPELDDVVRISDDSGRGHGRIESEHRA